MIMAKEEFGRSWSIKWEAGVHAEVWAARAADRCRSYKRNWVMSTGMWGCILERLLPGWQVIMSGILVQSVGQRARVEDEFDVETMMETEKLQK